MSIGRKQRRLAERESRKCRRDALHEMELKQRFRDADGRITIGSIAAFMRKHAEGRT